MFIKNKLTGAIFEVTEKYYEDYQKNNKDIEVMEEPKKKAVKPTIVLGGE